MASLHSKPHRTLQSSSKLIPISREWFQVINGETRFHCAYQEYGSNNDNCASCMSMFANKGMHSM